MKLFIREEFFQRDLIHKHFIFGIYDNTIHLSAFYSGTFCEMPKANPQVPGTSNKNSLIDKRSDFLQLGLFAFQEARGVGHVEEVDPEQRLDRRVQPGSCHLSIGS